MKPQTRGRKASASPKHLLPAWVVPAVLVAVIVLLSYLVLTPKGPGGQTTGAQTLAPAPSWPHTHGLGVDGKNPGVLYIGTHGIGVMRLEAGGTPMRVGSNGLDLMGYTVHPIDGRIQFSSGHPAGGGSVGVIKSEDGGLTWRRIDTIPGRTVDFHSMTVSPARPDTLYAWYYGDRKFYRSTDGGVTWTNPAARGLGASVVALAGDPASESTVLAGTDRGIYRSTDGGETWSLLQNDLAAESVIGLAVDPKDNRTLYASGQFTGLWKSIDGGATFRISSRGLPAGDAVLFVAIDPGATNKLYAATVSKAIYRSQDAGTTWPLLWSPGS